jgi:hypothetical protein
MVESVQCAQAKRRTVWQLSALCRLTPRARKNARTATGPETARAPAHKNALALADKRPMNANVSQQTDKSKDNCQNRRDLLDAGQR